MIFCFNLCDQHCLRQLSLLFQSRREVLGLADVSFSMLVGPSAGAATWVGSIEHFVPGH